MLRENVSATKIFQPTLDILVQLRPTILVFTFVAMACPGNDSTPGTATQGDSDTASDCSPGSEACECVGGLCSAGLVCEDNTCRLPDQPASTASASGDVESTSNDAPSSTSISSSSTGTETTDDPDADSDGDGFPASVDCDDSDEHTFPLLNNVTHTLIYDTRICPGYYIGSSITIGANDVSVDGTDVIIDMEDRSFFDNRNLSAVESVIAIESVSGTELTGFEIIRFRDNLVAVLVSKSSDTYIKGLRAHDFHGNHFDFTVNTVTVRDSTSTKITHCALEGVGAGITLAGTGGGHSVTGCDIDAVPLPNQIANVAACFWVGSASNMIVGNQCNFGGSDSGIWVDGSLNIVHQNAISNVFAGIFAAHSSGGQFTENTVANASWFGVTLSGNNNVISNNVLEYGDTCIDEMGISNTVASNTCTPI